MLNSVNLQAQVLAGGAFGAWFESEGETSLSGFQVNFYCCKPLRSTVSSSSSPIQEGARLDTRKAKRPEEEGGVPVRRQHLCKLGIPRKLGS